MVGRTNDVAKWKAVWKKGEEERELEGEGSGNGGLPVYLLPTLPPLHSPLPRSVCPLLSQNMDHKSISNGHVIGVDNFIVHLAPLRTFDGSPAPLVAAMIMLR